MKKNWFIISALSVVLSLTSCNKNENTKRMYMWFDCEANYKTLSVPDSISYYIEKCAKAGFTDVVVDVKSIMGETLFKSKYAPYMSEWKGVKRSENYDLLAEFIKRAKKYNIKVHASLNVFCGGHNFHNRGIIYGDKSHWQSQNYWIDSIRPISSMKWNYNGMLNPALKEVQDYQMNIINEVVRNYPKLDGIVLDRGRYDGITSDFSKESKEIFQKFANLTVEDFPNDIIYWEKDERGNDIWKRGKHFNKWIEWRASVIYNFFKRCRSEIKEINPDLEFSDYTGAWYPVYYEVGVNWASNKYDPSKEYDWATPEYKNYGYAELLDTYMSGLYFYEVTIDEVNKMNEEMMKNRTEAAMGKGRDYWYSVEGSAKLAKKITMNAAPLFGGLYVEQYKGNKEQFQKAVKMAIKETDGLMVFDIVHIINRNWWDVLEEAVNNK